MTTLELWILVAETAALVLFLPPVAERAEEFSFARAVLCFLAPSLVIVHLASGAYRWEAIPAYLLAVLLTYGVRQRRLSAGLQIAGGLVLVAGFILTTVLPVFSLPAPGGRFPIGSMTFHLTDKSRRERMHPECPRELMMQIWYPAQPGSKGPPLPYIPPPGPPSFKTAHLARVRTHAIKDAAVAAGPFPVLLYSPSWRGVRSEDTFLVEMLASHGYVVACLDHPYGSARVEFPDGRVIRADGEPFLDSSSEAAYEEGMRDAIAHVHVRSADERFVLNELTRWSAVASGSPFSGHLDLARAGVFGFSFGGAVAAESCRKDSRFRACMNLDGSLIGEAADEGIDQPYLSIESPIATPRPAELESPVATERINARLVLRDLTLAQKYATYRVIIAGTQHMNFSDMPLYCRLRSFTHAGPIDPHRAMRIVNDYALAFFDEYLKGKKEPLLDRALARYPEVDFRRGTES